MKNFNRDVWLPILGTILSAVIITSVIIIFDSHYKNSLQKNLWEKIPYKEVQLVALSTINGQVEKTEGSFYGGFFSSYGRLNSKGSPSSIIRFAYKKENSIIICEIPLTKIQFVIDNDIKIPVVIFSSMNYCPCIKSMSNVQDILDKYLNYMTIKTPSNYLPLELLK